MNSKSKKTSNFILNNSTLEKVTKLIYLGLPVGNTAYLKEYWDQKINKTIKSFYGLNNIGCKSKTMSPRIMAQIYRIYCQPIMCYGLEILHINKTKVEELDSMQAQLIKNNIGLSKFARTTPLLNALCIESISQLYHKYKILFLKQINRVLVTKTIFEFLIQNTTHENYNKNSFISQIRATNNLIEQNIFSTKYSNSITELKAIYNNTNSELILKIIETCDQMNDQGTRNVNRNILAELLKNN